MNTLTLSTVAYRSIRFFLRSHTAVCLGIAAATAVIVGALVVGDSVRGSLRYLVESRLANIECLLHARNYFDPQLLAGIRTSQASEWSLVPLIYLPSSTVENRAGDQVRRGSHVQVLAVDNSFWTSISAKTAGAEVELAEDEIAINGSLAIELNAALGDELTLGLQSISGVPADNPLGRRDDSSLSLPRQKIVAILPDDGIGGVSFSSSQSVPRNVFCSKMTMQDILECGSQINATLVLSHNGATGKQVVGSELCDVLNRQINPRIEDYGLKLERIQRVFPDEKNKETLPDKAAVATIYDYFQLSSNQLVIDDDTALAISRAFQDADFRLLTYLANTIEKVVPLDTDLTASRSSPLPIQPLSGSQVKSRAVPYSTIVGLEGIGEQELWKHNEVSRENLRYPYCWINTWLASQLDARAGDWVQIKYYEPETVDGNERENVARFMIVGIVPLTEPARGFVRDQAARYDTSPTFFNDPDLTPYVPGLTDKDSIANWDAPFKLKTDLILDADDEYYENHRLTPKMFVRYSDVASLRMFGSRFGQTTAFRFVAQDYSDEGQLRAELEKSLASLRVKKGLAFVPIRDNLLQSATGTTPFDMLFLSLSFFVIVAALMLVMLLFKLGIQQRSGQLGLLAAQGFSDSRVRSLMMRELVLVALAGAVLGTLLGLGYARLMLAALQTWWIGAISTPFLQFHYSWLSLGIGSVAGLVISLLTIYGALRQLSRREPLELLRGQKSAAEMGGNLNKLVLTAIGGSIAGACALIFSALGQVGMARAGSFFGSGMLLLTGAVFATHQLLQWQNQNRHRPKHSTLFSLAWSAVHRNPLRSSLTLGLLSVACFLISSMSVFHVSPSARGYGGFNLLGESAQPIFRNIGSPAVRSEVLGADAAQLTDVSIMTFRVKPGEDASCNNLFQVSQPTILGVSQRMAMLNEFNSNSAPFEWAAAEYPTNPWQALDSLGLGQSNSPIPVILDQNTAAWSLKQGASLGAPIVVHYGDRDIHFRTVGLLSNSVLQGKLLISERNFLTIFPEISGNRFFMIQTRDAGEEQAVTENLEKGWSSEGLDITSSREMLTKLLGVQNTYISAFQSLGALGLLLGTFGLIAVQVRSVNERRGELALMQAVGFSKNRITRMLTWETAILLGGGLLIGCLAAAFALVPYLLENRSQISALNPLAMLILVVLAGYVAAIVAVRAAMKRSVLEGLRSE